MFRKKTLLVLSKRHAHRDALALMGITPFGQVLYDHLWNSGAAEKGSVANLSIRHGTADTLLSVAGAKFIWVCHLGGIRLTNTVWGGWRHEFLTPYYSVNATF